MSTPRLGTIVPYLFYDDIEAMLDWYARVLGFVEKDRWVGPDGAVQNAEMRVGDAELWMDGSPLLRTTSPDGSPRSLWFGVWLDDRAAVDAMYAHVVAEGIEPEQPPRDRPFGIRTFDVRDPQGYTWGFMCPIPRTDATG